MGRRRGGTGDATSALVESASSWAKAIGKEIQTVAPGALQGALTGFMTGGPAGAALGAVAGGVGAHMGSPATRGAAPGALASPTGDANIAAVQLLAALLRPEVIQALGAMASGSPAAPQTVSVAGTPVPVAAFANMIGALAGAASAQHTAQVPPSAASPAYLAGRPAATPGQRAEALLGLLHEAAREEAMSDWDDDDGEDVDEVDDWNEALMDRDLADLHRLEAEGDW